MVASTSPKVVECQSIGLCETAWKTKLAVEIAKDIMLRLNAICCGLNFEFLRGQHCTAVEMQVMATASAALRFTAAVRRNGRFIDMLPFTPGSFTFIREVAAASAKTAIAK